MVTAGKGTLEKPIKPNKRGDKESEKEFRMIARMIQKIENKMELQINSLETRIEKMKELFKKEVEDIFKKVN